jgi:hypothetical protein
MSTQNRSRRNWKSFLFGVGYTLGPVGAAVVLVWVGFWGLLDHYLFPEDDVLSAAACLVFAIGLATLCHALSSSNYGTNSLVFVILTASLGVCFWRGVWKLWESLVLADTPLAQSLLAITIGVGILMATGNFQHTVVGPPILFPPAEESTMPSDSFQVELTTPLQDKGAMEPAIATVVIN